MFWKRGENVKLSSASIQLSCVSPGTPWNTRPASMDHLQMAGGLNEGCESCVIHHGREDQHASFETLLYGFEQQLE